VPTLRTASDALRVATAALTAALALATAGCVAARTATPVDQAPGDTRVQLAQLTVASPGSMRGYSRARFPHWRETGKNCDVRDEVLRRDGQGVKLNGCNVVDGVWLSPYDNRTYTDPQSVDIDHMVPLANAWRSGAAAWTDERREEFANDLRRPQLRAVSRSANRAKGDQDPSQWKPADKRYWCRYAQDWVAVKAYWQLTVTTAEKTALTRMLETCEWPSHSTAPPTSSPAPVGS
jgi:hypothetical protein